MVVPIHAPLERRTTNERRFESEIGRRKDSHIFNSLIIPLRMKVGFIGYGNMGSIMVRSLLCSGALDPENVMVSNRSATRMSSLKEHYPAVEQTTDNTVVARKSGLIFICVRSDQVDEVVREILPSLDPLAHVVLINGGVSMAEIQQNYGLKISKVIPSVTMEVGRGVTLICHGQEVEKGQKELLENMFGSVGPVKVIVEDCFDVGTYMTSCGPAFVAAFIEEFAEAAVRQGSFSRDEARAMVTETVLATAALMIERGKSSEEICHNVATRGGITEEGLKVLHRGLPSIFDEVVRVTLVKHEQS